MPTPTPADFERLSANREDQYDPELFLMFDPQGHHKPGMGKVAYEASPEARQVFEAGSDAVGYDLKKVAFGDNADELQKDSLLIQPTIVTCSLAEYAWYIARGEATPAIVGGPSMGLYTAAAAAGAIATHSEAIAAVHERAIITNEFAATQEGRMGVVFKKGKKGNFADETKINGKTVGPAVVRDSRYTISGEAEELTGIVQGYRDQSITAQKLDIFIPAHNKMLAGTISQMRKLLRSTIKYDPVIPVLANDTLPNYDVLITDKNILIEHLLDQMTNTAYWSKVVSYLREFGIRKSIQLGVDSKRSWAEELEEYHQIQAIQLATA